MGTLRYAASRLLQAIGLVLAVVVLNFVLVHAAPGDPVETIAGASGGMSPGAACTSTKLSTTTASTRPRAWSRREAA